MFEDLDVVKSLVAVPAEGVDAAVRAGQVGTVVSVFEAPREGYLVEFSDDDGQTLAMPTMLPEELEFVWRQGQPVKRAA